MRAFLGWMLMLSALCACADNPNPFFTGDDVTVSVGVNSITIGNAVWQRTIGYDLVTTSLKHQATEMLAASSSEGTISLDDRDVDLAGSSVLGKSVTDAPDSKIVRLLALKDELYFTVCYRVFKGNRPWYMKWIEFPSPTYVRSVKLEQLAINPNFAQGTYGDWGDNGRVAGGLGHIFGFQINDMKPVAGCYRSDGSILGGDVRLGTTVTKTPEFTMSISSGTRYTGAFSMQLFWATYIAHASATNRPVVYNTWYAYKWAVTDVNCYTAIPLAKQVGADMFVVDDGWETTYGDWQVQTKQFPGGLKPVADAARQAGMDFGFWIAPAMTKPTALSFNQADLIKNSDGSVWLGNGWPIYCFATDRSGWITDRVVDLVHQTGAKFLKLDFTVQRDMCFDITHPHPPGQAQVVQNGNWRAFTERLRAEQPGIQLYRAYARDGDLACNDFSWHSDWLLAGLNDPRRSDARYWFRSADSTRFATGYPRYLAPPFCLSGTTPGHIAGFENRSDLLDYNITSVAANYDNLEFSGTLEGSTSLEVALCQKWVAWFRENQAYLAFGQTDDTARRCYDPSQTSNYGSEWVDGIYHLRPELNGKYGYLCFWNPSDSPQTVDVDINPSDYFLPAGIATTSLRALNAGWWKSSAGPHLQTSFVMPPLSWEIVEVDDPNYVGNRKDLTIHGTATFEGLAASAPTPSTMRVQINSADGPKIFDVAVDGGGGFEISTNLPEGPFTISAKPSHWLRNSVQSTNGGGDVSVSMDFLNGDANGDNTVGINDAIAVLLNFMGSGTGDFDESGTVDLADLTILLVNFGRVGDG